MMIAIFSALLLAVLIAWAGLRQPAIYLFSITFITAIFWFHHHVTSALTIQL